MKNKTTPTVSPADIPIREIRGQRVLLDSDLATIYGVPAKALNQAVKRNAGRFPEDFWFRLTEQEWGDLRSQFVTASSHGGRRSLPFAFTEHGALQAANILKSERAAAMSVFVIRAFVQMRVVLLGTTALATKLAELEERLTGRLDTQEHAIVHVMQQLVKLLAPPSLPPRPPKPKIGFKP